MAKIAVIAQWLSATVLHTSVAHIVPVQTFCTRSQFELQVLKKKKNCIQIYSFKVTSSIVITRRGSRALGWTVERSRLKSSKRDVTYTWFSLGRHLGFFHVLFASAISRFFAVERADHPEVLQDGRRTRPLPGIALAQVAPLITAWRLRRKIYSTRLHKFPFCLRVVSPAMLFVLSLGKRSHSACAHGKTILHLRDRDISTFITLGSENIILFVVMINLHVIRSTMLNVINSFTFNVTGRENVMGRFRLT